MSPETLDRLCAEALQRIAYFVHRSTGQHLRRMREGWANPTNQLTTNEERKA